MKKTLRTGMILLCMIGCTQPSKPEEKITIPELKKDTFIIEYGQPIRLDKQDVLDTTEQEILDTVKVNLSSVKNEKDKKYPAVGEYKVKISFEIADKKHEREVKVEVKDTEAPQFTKSKKRVEIDQDDTAYDFNKDFKIRDLSDHTISFETDEVKFKIPGEYEARAVAQDRYGNKKTKTFTVVIKNTLRVSSETEAYPSYSIEPYTGSGPASSSYEYDESLGLYKDPDTGIYYDYHPDSGEYYEYDVDSMYQSSESVEEYTE